MTTFFVELKILTTASKVQKEGRMMKIRFFVAILVLVQSLVAGEPDLHCEKNWGEIKWQGMKFHRYHLRASDFPPSKTYRLIVENYDGQRTETFDYVSNQKGRLILMRPDEDYEDDIYLICSAKRGERLIFWMESQDDAYATELVPFPLGMKSKKGVKLDLELKGEQGEKFLFTGNDLEPYENVDLFLEIKNERVLLNSSETSEYGELSAMIDLPEDPDGGEANLILKRKNEEIVFPFSWGPPALKIVGACCFEIK